MIEKLLHPKSHWICEKRVRTKNYKTIEEIALQYLTDQLTRARKFFELGQDIPAGLYLDRMIDYYNKTYSKDESHICYALNELPANLKVWGIPCDFEDIKRDDIEGLDPEYVAEKMRNIDRLMASAHAIYGRIYEDRIQVKDADSAQEISEKKDIAFKKALDTFEKLWYILKNRTSDEYNDYGITLYQMKRPEEALQILQEAKDHNIASSDTFKYLGIIYNTLGNYIKAEFNLNEYLKIFPNDTQISRILADVIAAQGRTIYAAEKYRDIADIMVREGKFEASIKMIELALEQVFKSDSEGQRSSIAISLREQKVQILLKLGRYHEALATIDEVLKDEENSALALTYKGITLYSINLYNDALESLDQALELEETDSLALAIKGASLMAIHRYEEAQIILANALEGNEENIIALWGMAQFLFNEGRYEDALTYLDKASVLEPNNINIIRSRGYCLLSLGRINEALESINKGLELDDDNAWLLADKTLALLSRGDYTNAEKELKSAFRSDPKNPWALKLKGQLLCDIAEYSAAIEALDQIIETDPFDYQCLFLKAWALEQQSKENASSSLRLYKMAIELNPMDIRSHMGLANTLRLTGDFDSASKEFLWIIDVLNKEPYLEGERLSLLGWCYCCMGEYHKGIRLYLEALDIIPDSISIRFDLALALLYSGKKEYALRDYLRGLDLADHEHILRIRGLLAVALNNLVNAMDIKPEVRSNEAQKAKDLLSSALEKAKLPKGLCWISQ
jgi:tetratricopeptide (TPR) repeat protein